MSSLQAQECVQPPWHSMSVDAVFKKLHGSKEGLTLKEVRRRRKIFGLNELKRVKPQSAWIRFFRQFHNVLIYILLVSAVITGFLAHWVDMGVILGVVVLNAIIGFIQEGKAEKALRAIRQMLSPQAIVVRDGKRVTISAKQLVPGDIVLLQSGDKVPADLRLFNTKTLRIQEATLTGESKASSKKEEPAAEACALPDRESMAYSSTIVTYGRAEGIVVATGQKTEIGQISTLVSRAVDLQTPLLRQMSKFARWLTAAIILLAIITFCIGAFVWDDSGANMFMAVVGLAVAAIPEGLPAVMTITLAIGVTRMAKRNAIIRRLPAVETMGSVSTICTDKTGTLTRNELSVQEVLTAEHHYHVSGSGYNATGQFRLNRALFPMEEHRDLRQLVRAGVLCNDAQLLETEEGDWELEGNPIDGALLSLGLKAKFDFEKERTTYQYADTIPFESEHKFMASLYHDHKGVGYIFIKGAPERILKRCRFQRFNGKDEDIVPEFWHQKIEELAAKGLRLVALAMRQTDAEHQVLKFEDVDDNLILLGFVGLIDSPREEAIRAVAECKTAGINVKMITGDHALTAQTIAEQIGIDVEAGVLTGEMLDTMTDEEFEQASEKINVYARTSPTHKLRLVEALQKRGNVIAMTGDGVNDAPALRQADIGVAMGKKGTEATKEVADMVLADDNFNSIYHAVREGRTVYDNLRKAILYILPTSFGEAFMILLAISLGMLLPITAVQILWVNMITAVTFALSIGFEPPEKHVMSRPPRLAHAPLLSKLLVWRVIFVSILMLACGFGMYLYERHMGADLMTARTVVVNMLVVCEGVYLFNCRRIYRSVLDWKILISNIPALIAVAVVVVFQLAFTYLPGMDLFFGVTPIGWICWSRIFIVGLGMFFVIEIEKVIVRRFIPACHQLFC